MGPCPTTIAIADAYQQRDRKLRTLLGKSQQRAYRPQRRGIAALMQHTIVSPLAHLGGSAGTQAATVTRMPPPLNPCGWKSRRWLLRARGGRDRKSTRLN